jgi:hypothetical protein
VRIRRHVKKAETFHEPWTDGGKDEKQVKMKL